MSVLFSRRVMWLLGFVLVFTQAATAATPRILVVGDSWAALETYYLSFESAMAEDGITEWSAKGNVTGLGGTKASDWVQPGFLAFITQELAANPTIDIVHISLGGNDLLGYVKGTRTPAELASFYQSVANNLKTIVDHCLAQRPDVRVGLSSYDYIGRTQEGMTIQQVNAAFLDFAPYVRAVADTSERCVYLNHHGLMQHHFGVPGVYAPGELPAPGGPPDYTPFAAGDVNYPGVALGDPIHLDYAGYLVLAHSCLDQQYYEWLGITDPALTDASAMESSPASAETIHFRVEFSEPVTGVTQDDFLLNTEGEVTGAEVAGVFGSGAVYTVTVNRGMGSGVITLVLRDDDSIQNVFGRVLDGFGTGEITGGSIAIQEVGPLPLAMWPVLAALGVCAAAMARRRRSSRE